MAHQVVAKYKFKRYVFAHDLIGCEYDVTYDIKREYVILERDEEENFFYLNTNKKCEILNYDYLDVPVHVEPWGRCNKSTLMQGSDCKSKKEMEDTVIGVIDVQDIEEITRTNDIDEGIRIINEYNKAL